MDSLGGQFQKFRWTKLLPSPPLWGYSNNPKKGGLIQETGTLRTTFESRFLAYPPIYTRVEAIGGSVGAFREGGTPRWGVRFAVQGGLFRTLSTFNNMEEFYPTFAACEERALEASLSFSIVNWRICSLSCPISSACCIIFASFR